MKQRVIFVPDWSKVNPYLNMLKDAVSAFDYEVTLRDFPSGYFPLNQIINKEGRIAVIHLHWINDLVAPIIWSSTLLKRRLKLGLLRLDITLARLRGVRIIWTIHNLVSHESPDPAAEIQGRRAIAQTCTWRLVHSDSALRLIEKTYGVSLAGNTSVIPLGNYDGCYQYNAEIENRLRRRFGIEETNLVILFFGAIRQYKGVEKLIDSFRNVEDQRLRLLIAGKANSEEVDHAIRAAAKDDPRIVAALGFVPDEEVSGMFALADVVAIPFERTLTSGSAVLAFTMSKALLLPEQARVFDFVSDENAIFFRSDDDLRMHLGNLDKQQLATMGGKGRLAVAGLNWQAIGDSVAATYAK